MSRLKDNLIIWWPLAVGLALFVPTAWRYYELGLPLEYLGTALVAFHAFACTAFPEEVSSWTGRYGWTYESFWTYPATYVQFFGVVTQVWVLLFGFA